MSGSRKALAALYGQLAQTYTALARELSGDGATTHAAASVATDADLDGQYGDPEIRRDPKRWQGPSFVGRRYSQCSPEFLDELASFKEWSAANPREGAEPKYADYDRRDASRARGWARRIRNGWKPPSEPEPPDDFDAAASEELPF